MAKRDDALWKSILETVFREFLLFFYPPKDGHGPNADEIFDFSKGFVYLDKELDTLFPSEDGNKGVRFVDKLVKVFLKDGGEQFILVHIEVQSQKGKDDLEERMFRYYYRVRDKYNVPISAIAILADDNRSYHPTEHIEGFLNTQLIYRFDTYKIIEQDEAALRANPNPFAVCILTALLALKRRGADDNELKAMKHDLYDEMKRRSMSKEKRWGIRLFLTYFARFEKKQMFTIFEDELKQKQGEEDTMGITEYLLDKAKQEGVEKTRKEERAKAKAEKLKSALEFKKMGVPIADIAKGLGLTVEQVEKLK